MKLGIMMKDPIKEKVSIVFQKEINLLELEKELLLMILKIK
jgi:hypothetical protein